MKTPRGMTLPAGEYPDGLPEKIFFRELKKKAVLFP